MNQSIDLNQLINDAPLAEREATYHACWIVALCDGRLWREKRLVEEIAAELKLDKQTARAIEKQARRGERDFGEPATDAGRRVMFHFALKVAAADGKISDDEREYAHRCGRHFGLDAEEIDAELARLMPEQHRPRVRRTTRTARRSSKASRSRRTEQSSESASSLVEGMRADAIQAGAIHQFANYVLPFLLMLTAHVVPLVGILFYGWNAASVLGLYWAENVVVGIFAAFKIRLARPTKAHSNVDGMWFFCAHYGIFTTVHGVFVIALSGWMMQAEDALVVFASIRAELPMLAIALLSIVVQHGYAFFVDYLREEQYLRTTVDDQFGRPYPRMFALHCSIIFGGMLASQFGKAAIGPVLMMVGLHLFVETVSWVLQLPKTGFLGGVGKVVGGGLFAAGFALVPLGAIGVVGFFVVLWLAGLLAWLSPALRHVPKTLTSTDSVGWIVGTIGLTTLFAFTTGALLALLDHQKTLDSGKLVESLSKRQIITFLACLVGLSGLLNALIP